MLRGVSFKYDESFINKYRIREQLLKAISDSIYKEFIFIHEKMLYMLGNEVVSNQVIEELSKVNCMRVIGGISQNNTSPPIDFFKYFKRCKIVIIENMQSIFFLHYFTNITELTIDIQNPTRIFLEFQKLKNLASVQRLNIKVSKTERINYEVLENFQNIKSLELECRNGKIEMNTVGFSNFLKLKEIRIINKSSRDGTKKEVIKGRILDNEFKIVDHIYI